jgi:hypothetical protein
MDLALLLVGQNGQGMKGQNRPFRLWQASADMDNLARQKPLEHPGPVGENRGELTGGKIGSRQGGQAGIIGLSGRPVFASNVKIMMFSARRDVVLAKKSRSTGSTVMGSSVGVHRHRPRSGRSKTGINRLNVDSLGQGGYREVSKGRCDMGVVGAGEKWGQKHPPPSPISEAEADAGHQLIAREIVLVTGVAIFGQNIDGIGQRLLGPDAQAHAIAIGCGVIARQAGADAAIGITDLGAIAETVLAVGPRP